MHMQVLQSTMTWKQCADLPTDLAEGQSVVISGKIYNGGSAAAMDEYIYTLSIPTIHRGTSGTLYHLSLSDTLAWVKSMKS